MCTVPLPPGGYPIEVNKYIISYGPIAATLTFLTANIYWVTKIGQVATNLPVANCVALHRVEKHFIVRISMETS